MPILSEKNLTVIRKKGTLPRVPFAKLKTAVLGKNYDLTISFISPNESVKINKTYRKKDYVANVLSFPLGKESGELYLSLSQIRRDAKKFNLTYHNNIIFMVIHGMLHLKGEHHGSTMERNEARFLKKFCATK